MISRFQLEQPWRGGLWQWSLLRKASSCLKKACRAYKLKWTVLNSAQVAECEKILAAFDADLQAKRLGTLPTHIATTKALLKGPLCLSLFQRLRRPVAYAAALSLGLYLLQTLFIDVWHEPGDAMQPTLVAGTGVLIKPQLPKAELRRTSLVKVRMPNGESSLRRLACLPGDTVYFYGGQIYGVDSAGEPFEEQGTETIPLRTLEGKLTRTAKANTWHYSQFGQAIARIDVRQDSQGQQTALARPLKQGSVFGLQNYGLGRLRSYRQLPDAVRERFAGAAHAPLYLEIHHHFVPAFPAGVSKSYLPLYTAHIEQLLSQLTTRRFLVRNQLAVLASDAATSQNAKIDTSHAPSLYKVPNGLYEFDAGVGYEIAADGSRRKLSASHPLMSKHPKMLKSLYNFGIEFDKNQKPTQQATTLLPARYIYFRHGSLYTIGAKLMSADDATLQAFIQNEEASGSGFIDEQRPDIERILSCGLIIPPGKVLVLADNYAAGTDSRDVGLLDSSAIEGLAVASYTRDGFSWLTPPNTPLAGPEHIALLGLASAGLYRRKQLKKRPIYRRHSHYSLTKDGHENTL